MSAHPDFLEVWRSGTRDVRVLVRLSLRDPVTLAVTTVRAASSQTHTPEFSPDPVQFWPPGVLDVQPIRAPGSFGETGISLCSTSLTLDPKVVPNTKLLTGSTCEVFLWDTRLTIWARVLMVFKGEVLGWERNQVGLELTLRQRVNYNRDVTPVVVTAEQYPQANEQTIGQSIPILYGALTDIPWRYPWPTFPEIEDVTAATVLRGAAICRNGRRAGLAVMVDTGRGSGMANNPSAKVLCASHKVTRLGDLNRGAGFYLKHGELLCPLEVPPADVLNTTTEAGLLLADNIPIGWAAALPTDVAAFANTAENHRAILDPMNDVNYARLDWTAGYKFTHAHFPALPSELGVMAEVFVFVAYRSPAHTNLTLRIYRDASPTAATDFALPVTATRKLWMKRLATGPAWGTGAVGNHVPVQPYAFSEVNMEVGWSTFPSTITGTGTAECYFCGFIVKFAPGQLVLEAERNVSHVEYRPSPGPRGESPRTAPYTVEEQLPAVTEMQGKFYVNAEGRGDDGAGTYAADVLILKFGTCTIGINTISFANAPQLVKDRLLRVQAGDLVVTSFFSSGTTVTSYNPTTFVLTCSTTALLTSLTNRCEPSVTLQSQLLRRAPDIARHLLVTYGGEALANIVSAVDDFGSFTNARSALKNLRGQEMEYAFSVDKTTDVNTALSWLAEGSLSFIFLDRFSDRWMMRPWITSASLLGEEYDWTFRPKDLIERAGPLVRPTPVSFLSTGVSLSYGYSAHTGQHLHQTRLAWDGSNSGHKYRGFRDGYLTVTTANNKLQWNVQGVGNFTATIPSGDYTPATFAAAVDAAMKAADAPRDYVCVNGATIVSGYNDQIFYRDTINSTDRTVTLTPGAYSFESLALHVAAVMDAANGAPPNTMFVSYGRSSRKWTFERNYGVSGESITLYRTTSGLRAKRFLATIGFDQNGASITSNGTSNCTGEYERDDEFFVVGCVQTPTNLLWQSGSSGLDFTRTSAHSLLGFEQLRDRDGQTASPTITVHLADSPKSAAEAPILKTAQRYGARRDTVADLRAVQDTETALELRNRMATLFGKPRLMVDFATELAPDLERTRVIRFHGDMDAVMPYPDPDSDGSWVGKRFVVVETEQMLGPAAFYTKVRAVSLD